VVPAAVCERRTHYVGDATRVGDTWSGDGPATEDASPTRANNGQPATGGPTAASGPWPLALSESELSTLWEGQRFPAAALITRAGAPVRVLHPGRAGRGAGPDFRDAILTLERGIAPAGVLRGDVELHVRASDFRAHGHAQDRRYDRVVLHVVFEDEGEAETRLACGRSAPVVALAPWVRKRAHELHAWLSSPRLWREPCAGAIARLGAGAVRRELERLGDERFGARVEAIRRETEGGGAAGALYRALVAGLGYGGDRAAFARIAERLPWAEAAGLLEGGTARAAALEHRLLAAAAGLQHSGRPANHPARRLAGLARLLVRQRALFADAPDIAAWLALTPRELIAAFSAPPLIGRGRAIELLTNAVLPWTAALAAQLERADLAEQAFERYAELPRPARYGALAFLEQNLHDGGKPLAPGARQQQGLLALYKSECTQGGCGRCELSR
jgi:hypothetical protein